MGVDLALSDSNPAVGVIATTLVYSDTLVEITSLARSVMPSRKLLISEPTMALPIIYIGAM